jgi:hypothetical protein
MFSKVLTMFLYTTTTTTTTTTTDYDNNNNYWKALREGSTWDV